MQSRILPAVTAIALTLPTCSFAEELNTIVVSAARVAQSVDETLAPVTVVTREDIERMQANTVIDVLRGSPGIQFNNNGGPGQVTTFFLRGTESDHVVVLIDGVKVGSATVGFPEYQFIPADHIERIEIVRGPKSSLYGPEAVGGVIHIFTRKGERGFSPYMSVSNGTYNYKSINAGVSGGTKNYWYSLSATSESSDGFNACDTDAGINFKACFVSEPDDDGYKKQSVATKFGFSLGNRGKVEASLLQNWNEAEYDGSIWSGNNTEFTSMVAGINAVYDITDIWTTSISFGLNDLSSRKDFEGTETNTTESTRHTISFQNDIDLDHWGIVTIGADHINDNIDSTTSYAETERTNNGVFVQWLDDMGRFNWQLSARRDVNEQFGSHNTGAITLGYELSNKTRLIGSYGTAFKAPNFNELYYPFGGNEALKPESSRTVEIGIRTQQVWGSLDVNVYRTQTKNQISVWPIENIEEAQIEGAEFIYGIQLNDWNINANLNLLNPTDQGGGANDGNLLPRRSRGNFRVDVDKRWGAFSAGATLYGEGERYDDAANTIRLSPYRLLNLRFGMQATDELTLQAKIDNLLNEDYETALYYNQAGTSVYLTLTYKPKFQ